MTVRPYGGSFEDLLLDLQVRLRRVETHLGLAALEREREPELKAEPRPEPKPEPTPPWVETHAPAPAVPPPLPVMRQSLPPVPLDEPLVPLATVYPEYQAPPPVAPAEQTELEQTIGLKWAGWIGAVVVVIGAGLGIKYAYDQRWFEILPPAGRLMLMSLGGIALLAAGEFVFRRIHRVAAACLFGAGVATLFLVSYAGHGYYRLYEPETAYVLMALTTAVGAAVAVRGNLLSIAVLSQIGGNLAPLLLRSDRPILGAFLAYLLALQVVALVLCGWARDVRWGALRVMSLTTTSLWMIGILIDRYNPRPETGVVLVFTLLYAALYQVEIILSAVRAGRTLGADVVSQPLSLSTSLASPAALVVTFSTGVTALLTTAVLFILRDIPDAGRGAWVIGLAGACAALGFVLSRNRSEGHPVYALALAYRVQAAALVVVAVPVALSGVSVIFGWAILSLAFATLGNLLNLRISRWAGVMVWRLALLYLGWWTVAPVARAHGGALEAVGAHAVWLQLFGENLRAYTVLAWFLAAVGHTVAWLIHQEGLRPAEESNRKFQRLAWVTSAMAGFAFFAASVAGLPPAGSSFAILCYVWVLVGFDLLNPRLGLALQSAVVVVLVTMKWVAVDTLAERLAPGWTATARRPLFNAVMFVGVLISATMGALYWLRRDVLWSYIDRRRAGETDPTVSPAAPLMALAAVLMTLFTIGLTVEIDRIIEAARGGGLLWPAWQLKQMAWTILWTLSLSAYLALCRRLEPDAWFRPGWVRTAEVLLVLVALKFLVIDTLFFRAFAGAPFAFPLANFQMLTAAVVVGGMILVSVRPTSGTAVAEAATHRPGGLFAFAGFLAVLVVLWGGTLEIDRAFERLAVTRAGPFANPGLAKQVAFSIFWSLFAVGAIVAGFRFRTKGLRYFGLGLFAVTLLKVVLFDMSDVQTGYRVLSFLGLGLLLMGTSVLYGKLSPVLLRREPSGAGMIPAPDASPTVQRRRARVAGAVRPGRGLGAEPVGGRPL